MALQLLLYFSSCYIDDFLENKPNMVYHLIVCVYIIYLLYHLLVFVFVFTSGWKVIHKWLRYALTHSRRRPISYINQSIDFLCKSMDWFLFDIGLRRERVNDTHREKLVLYWIQGKNSLKYKIGCFWRFTYVYTINIALLIPLSYICLKNVIHQIYSKNKWLLLYGKTWVGFCLNTQKSFFLEFSF